MLFKYMHLFYFSPWRIVDDCGGAFSMGAIGGSLFHGIVGMRNAPKVSARTSTQTNIRYKIFGECGGLVVEHWTSNREVWALFPLGAPRCVPERYWLVHRSPHG